MGIAQKNKANVQNYEHNGFTPKMYIGITRFTFPIQITISVAYIYVK